MLRSFAATALTGPNPPTIGASVGVKWTGFMNDTMSLVRTTFTDRSTIGELDFDGFKCFILEPSSRRSMGRPLAIPSGKYEISLYPSEKNHRTVPLLNDVPGRSFIEIHIGNKPGDTEGCLLPGMFRELDYVSQSKVAFDRLFFKIENRLKIGKLYIDICGGVLRNAVESHIL